MGGAFTVTVMMEGAGCGNRMLRGVLILTAAKGSLMRGNLVVIVPNIRGGVDLPHVGANGVLRGHGRGPALRSSGNGFGCSRGSLSPRSFVTFAAFGPHTFRRI